MFKKTISTLALTAAILGTTCMPAFAATPEVNTPDTSSTYTTVQPRINWTGTAKLNTTSYQNITSSNNVFPDSPTVTSDANNPGTVTLRVIDDKGFCGPHTGDDSGTAAQQRHARGGLPLLPNCRIWITVGQTL